ncbi:STAS domain-containing protein [Actinophytocola sp.]|uniref:STAS domain-containing protein n=1 Tax=Actinophytocola sp. TaxID=1872138 RepID=UPI002ED982FF
MSAVDRGPMPSGFEAQVFSLEHTRPGARLVRVFGTLSHRAGAELLLLVDEQRALSMDILILDLTELTSFDAEAVRVLVKVASELGRLDIGLCLVASDGIVSPALAAAGVRAMFELHGSVADALDVP